MSRKCPLCHSPVRLSILDSTVDCPVCDATLRPTRLSMALVLAVSLVLAKLCSELLVRPSAGVGAAIAAELGGVALAMPLAYRLLVRLEPTPKPAALDLFGGRAPQAKR